MQLWIAISVQFVLATNHFWLTLDFHFAFSIVGKSLKCIKTFFVCVYMASSDHCLIFYWYRIEISINVLMIYFGEQRLLRLLFYFICSHLNPSQGTQFQWIFTQLFNCVPWNEIKSHKAVFFGIYLLYAFQMNCILYIGRTSCLCSYVEEYLKKLLPSHILQSISGEC